MTKEITKKDKTSVGNTMDYGEMSGAGFEDTRSSDLSIPFLNLLQSNSPVVEDELIEGAKTGDILNSVTGELIKGDKGVVFIPVHKQEAWVQWVPRLKGGGFAGSLDPNGDIVQNLIKENGNSRIPPKGSDGKRIPFMYEGNEVVETYYIYGLILNDDGTEVESFAVVAFSSTKIKPYRDWLTSMYLLKGKPPIFANRALIKSVKQKNDAGTYANFDIKPLKSTWAESLISPSSEHELLEEAVKFQKMVLSGDASADFTQQDVSGATAGDKEEPSF